MLHEHGFAASDEPISDPAKAGLKEAEKCQDYDKPPLCYTLFCWGNDIAYDYDLADECGWSGYGGIYAVGIGACGEYDDDDYGPWFSSYDHQAVISYLGAIGERPETEDELEEMKEDLLAAAKDAYFTYCM